MLNKIFSKSVKEAASLNRIRTLFPSYNSAKAFSEAFNDKESISRLDTVFNIVKLNNFADSSKYYIRYVNLKTKCDAIKNGLENLNSSFENYYNSYKQISKNYSSIEKRILSKNYESLKLLSSNYSYIRRINDFDDSNFGDLNNFKHPGLIDYYFQRKSLCSVKYGVLRLPILQETKNYVNNVIVDYKLSNNFLSEDSIENLKTINTSYSSVYKTESIKENGSDLCFIFEFNKKRETNIIKIVDSSIKSASIKEVFYYSGENKINIDFSLIKVSNESILFLQQNIKTKRFYIVFNQKNYIDYEADTSLTKEEIVKKNTNSSFEVKKDETPYYWYEINIDEVSFINEANKNLGMIKLEEVVDTSSLDEVYVYALGVNSIELSALEIYVQGYNNNAQEIIGSYSIGGKIEVSKYSKIEFIIILKENVTIKALDIRGT